MQSETGAVLTGRKVLLILVAFFGVMFVVNFIMAYYAIATFPGLASDSAYAEGLAYDNEIAAARAQDKLNWKVDASLTRIAPGRSMMTLTEADAGGQPVEGLVATATFEHPADRARDRQIVLAEDAPGIYRGTFDIAAGEWDLFIDLTQAGERKFRSHNRVEIDEQNGGP